VALIRALAILALLAAAAHAQPAAETLRTAAAAAEAGDWARVTALVEPLADAAGHAVTERAEANRLAGLAAFFQQRRVAAEHRFLAFLRVERDALLDPAIYPPDVVAFFNDVKLKHRAELRPPPVRTARWYLNLVPPVGQLQNGERRKAVVLGGALGALVLTNVTTYLVIRARCERVTGSGGSSAVCEDGNPTALQTVNLLSGLGALAAYAYGVYDGVVRYRRARRTMPMFNVGQRHIGLAMWGRF
jgi:hypothetical protein